MRMTGPCSALRLRGGGRRGRLALWKYVDEWWCELGCEVLLSSVLRIGARRWFHEFRRTGCMMGQVMEMMHGTVPKGTWSPLRG